MNLALIYKLDRLLGSLCFGFLTFFQRRRSREMPEHFQCITVVKFLGGGSLTLAAPAVFAVKKRNPSAELLLLTTPEIAPNAELLGMYDRILLFSPSKPLAALKTLWQLKKHLKKQKSLVLDFELYSRFAHMMTAWLSPAFSLGLAQPGERTLWDKTISVPPEKPMYLAYDLAAEAVGAQTDTVLFQKHFAVEEKQPVLVAAPFCSALSLRRQWEWDKWIAFFNGFLTEYPDFKIVIVGGRSDREQSLVLCRGVNAGFQTQVETRCGTADFKTAFELIRQAALFVGIDSAPSHLARMCRVPAVTLWGATDPAALARPFENYPECILSCRQACTPCVHRSGQACPFGSSCTAKIAPERVLAAARRLLNGCIAASEMEIIELGACEK